MSSIQTENKLLIRHLEDIAAKAVKTGCAASRFLTPAEIAASRLAKKGECELSFDGGFENAERARAIFLQPEWGVYAREEWISALQIRCREQDSISHRDILGAVMAMGIERNVIGDIDADASPATLICLPEMRGHIISNLKTIGRVGVAVAPVALSELPLKAENLIEKTDTVTSLRLDAVLSAAFNLSRGEAAELIAAGYVSLNYAVCLQASKDVAEGALISARGKGRARVLEIGGHSRKGRIFLKIGLYGP